MNNECDLRARDLRASAEQQSECYTSVMRVMYAGILCAVLPKDLATFVASFIREKSVAEELSDLDGRRRDLARNVAFSCVSGVQGAVACERCGCRSWGADSRPGPRPGAPWKAQSYVPETAVEAYLADWGSRGTVSGVPGSRLGPAVSWPEKLEVARCGCDACWEGGCTHVAVDAVSGGGDCVQCGCVDEYDRNGERQCWCDPCAEFGCSTRLYRGRFSLVKYVGAGALDMDVGCTSCEGCLPSYYAQAPPCPQCSAPYGLDYHRGCGPSGGELTSCAECGGYF